ncbi:MAG: OmpP1/FadL family transporter, partial [Pseudomonadota bacterium]
MNHTRNLVALAVTAALTTPMSALATNGMNLEGYGPISTGMGGASMAIENGTAAMANNPATLDMLQGENQVDAALGVLAPDVSVSNAQGSADSASNSFTMPAAGWARKHNTDLTYGVGVFSQGGMGAEYGKSSIMAADTGQEARSEIGVGRVIFPVSFQVNDKLSVGGSFDYVWGGLDMKMPMAMGSGDPGTFSDFLSGFGGNQVLGEATMTAGLKNEMNTKFGSGDYDALAINFSDSSDFTQKASGTGYGAKLGMTFQHSEDLTFGAAYHMKTAMADWEGDASMDLYDTGGTNDDIAYDGTITIDNFQWPTTIALGGAYTPSDKLLLAADLKMLQWSEVMEDFSMTFEPDADAM